MDTCPSITSGILTLDFDTGRITPVSSLSTSPTCVCAAPNINRRFIPFTTEFNTFNLNSDNVDFEYFATTVDLGTQTVGTVQVSVPDSRNPSLFNVTVSGGAIVTRIIQPTPGTQETSGVVDLKFPIIDVVHPDTIEPLSSTLTFFISNFGTPQAKTHSMTAQLITEIDPQALCNSNNISLPPQPGPPVDNHNFCINPVITISATLSLNTGDVLEARFDVNSNIFYDIASKCYESCTSPIDNGTRFLVFSLFINCTVRGPFGSTGTLLMKFDGLTSLLVDVVGYALTKLILGRLTSGEFNIRWLYQCHYNELREKVFNSRYKAFVTVLDKFFDLNQYFFCCDEPQGSSNKSRT